MAGYVENIMVYSSHQLNKGVITKCSETGHYAYNLTDVFFEVDGASNLNARTMFFYGYTVVTPAMAGHHGRQRIGLRNRLPGLREASLGRREDLQTSSASERAGQQLLGGDDVRHPDPQFPAVVSLTKGLVVNADKSVDVYFGPKAPAGKENNWMQTMPGKGWNTIFRLYSPLEPWFDKTWRPGEIELVK